MSLESTPWKAIWICNLALFVMGIQTTVFSASMWPYLSKIDLEASLSFLGWIFAASSLAQAISGWFLGFWSQKSSACYPITFGFTFAAVGNFIYFYLPQIPGDKRWYMLVARIMTGIGSGTLSVLRSYVSTASSAKDRRKAFSLCSASFVIGISLGPAIQAAFVPIGTDGFRNQVFILNVYTFPPLLMVLVSIVAIVLCQHYLIENYAGINREKDKGQPETAVLPKFDKLAAFVCIYLSCLAYSVLIGIQINLTPFTKSLYDWTDEQVILYNGILMFVSSLCSVGNFMLLAFTFIGKIDTTKILLFSLTTFLIFNILVLPWPFYDGPLTFIQPGINSTEKGNISIYGGCLPAYTWCSYTTRVPLIVFLACFFLVYGFAFSYTFAPLGTIYSKILGPRKQGTMQGLLQFCAGIIRGVTPLIVLFLFEASGYLWISIMNIAITVVGIVLLMIFRKRIVPLEIIPKIGVPTAYKSGIFYRF